MAHSCVPEFPVGLGKHGEFKAPTDQEHDASESAAVVAAKLLSYARLALNLDTVLTEYSAQFLVDNACPNKVDGSRCCNLSVKECLRFAMEKGIPRADQWVHLGCTFKPSPSTYNPPLVSMKGELIETMNKDEALKLLQQLQQPVGARMHVFSPEIDDLVGHKTITRPPGGVSRYVGLRDVLICGVEEVDGEMVAKVMVFYKKKLACVKVAWDVMLDDRLVGNWDKAMLDAVLSQLRDGGPVVDLAAPKMVPLLSDFCVPRLSIE